MRWIWIDRILELSRGERIVAIKHASMGEDAVQGHFDHDDGLGPDDPVIPATFIIEGMAQTAGVLVGHAGDFREKVILAKITHAELTRDATPGATLRYTATIERLDRAGAATSGVVDLFDPAACAVVIEDDNDNAAASGAPPVAQPAPRYERIGRIDLLFSHIDHNFAGAEFPAHNFVFGESFKTLLRVSGMKADF